MSTAVASIVILAMQAVAAGLVWLASRPGAAGRKTIVGIPIAAVLVAFLSFGFFGDQPPRIKPQMTALREPSRIDCRRAIDRLTTLGLIMDISTPGEITVRETLWNELNSQVHTGITLCAQVLQDFDDEIEVIAK